MTRRWRGGRGLDPNQLPLDWSGGSALPPQPDPDREAEPRTEVPANPPPSVPTEPLTLKLKWDFRTSFPEPTEQAIASGTINIEDVHPDNIRGIHEEHAREMLATLHDLDAVLDAKRRGVHPGNNKAPMLKEARERLQKFFETEIPRLETSYGNLLGVYEDAFGREAADCFDKAVRAWHAGVEVVTKTKASDAPAKAVVPETQPTRPARAKPVRRRDADRVIARLPIPRPLASSVKAKIFGTDEDGRPIRPGPHEVRAITEQQAEALIDLIVSLPSDAGGSSGPRNDSVEQQIRTLLAEYAEDFGDKAARQLEAYARRQVRLRDLPLGSPSRR